MAVIIRVDVDRSYSNTGYRTLREYGVFPALDSLGYLKPCKRLINDLDARGVKASFFFKPLTLPSEELAQTILQKGHSVGLHVVHTQNFDKFSKELFKISKRFKGRIYGFTKHGSGKIHFTYKFGKPRFPQKRDIFYDPQKYVRYAKRAGLKYFLGNKENPEMRKKIINGITFFPSAFWLNRNHREDKFTVDWLIERSSNRDIVLLMHTIRPFEVELLTKEYEKIMDKVDIFKPIDEIVKNEGNSSPFSG